MSSTKLHNFVLSRSNCKLFYISIDFSGNNHIIIVSHLPCVEGVFENVLLRRAFFAIYIRMKPREIVVFLCPNFRTLHMIE